jgi:hypothetical protein
VALDELREEIQRAVVLDPLPPQIAQATSEMHEMVFPVAYISPPQPSAIIKLQTRVCLSGFQLPECASYNKHTAEKRYFVSY